MIRSRQGCRSEETQFPIATTAICGQPQKAGELHVQGRAVTTPVEKSACCLDTELASVLVSFVSFCQTVPGPYSLRRQLEHHVPVPEKDQDTRLLERSRSMQAALLPHLADESVSSAIHRATAVFGASPHVHRCAVMGGETAGQDHGRGCVIGRSSWLLQHLQPSRCSFESCLRRRHVWVGLPYSFTQCHDPHGGGV